MERNEGLIDRLVRVLVLAPLLVLAAVAVGVGSVAGIVALAVAAVMLVTGVSGYCPIYAVLHRRTNGSPVSN
ncbi:MAG: DUF2892 domain-containing protein [Acidimicrobiia bacterium]|nr:DUF2892 domain-containing protein [Acidimicrobiia bacterium]